MFWGSFRNYVKDYALISFPIFFKFQKNLHQVKFFIISKRPSWKNYRPKKYKHKKLGTFLKKKRNFPYFIISNCETKNKQTKKINLIRNIYSNELEHISSLLRLEWTKCLTHKFVRIGFCMWKICHSSHFYGLISNHVSVYSRLFCQ